MGKVLVLSDIHGNVTALRAVVDSIKSESGVEACILLGDVIDYGMHSNEVIEILQSFPFRFLCNIWGNHEHAIMTENYTRFSSDRGRQCARYTKSILNEDSVCYIEREMSPSGHCEFQVNGKRCLAVHGSLDDPYWFSLRPEQELSEYREYDYVFSGHSHHPHFFEKYYETDDACRRNRKKTVFINPGSVGQPRNRNNHAQYVVFDYEKEDVLFKKVCYNIKNEQKAYQGEVDEFYKRRLEFGI